MIRILLPFLSLILSFHSVLAQEDLLSLIDEEETTELVTASFKTNRIINLASLENTAKGVMDFKINHRFGFLNSGPGQAFGLDNATIRLGLDYGLSDRLMIGIGRSSFEKTIDGYAKLKLLRQSTGKRTMPFSVLLHASTAIRTIPFQNPDRENFFSSRLFHTGQIIIGRKFSEGLTLQIAPTLVHFNLVPTAEDKHDIYSVAGGGRVKLTKRLALNAEYIYVFPDQLAPGYRNSVAIGFDIETGGHVFQLHFTNSTSMIEKGFIAETTGDFFAGDIHFGFNVSRVFTIKSYNKKAK